MTAVGTPPEAAGRVLPGSAEAVAELVGTNATAATAAASMTGVPVEERIASYTAARAWSVSAAAKAVSAVNFSWTGPADALVADLAGADGGGEVGVELGGEAGRVAVVGGFLD